LTALLPAEGSAFLAAARAVAAALRLHGLAAEGAALGVAWGALVAAAARAPRPAPRRDAAADVAAARGGGALPPFAAALLARAHPPYAACDPVVALLAPFLAAPPELLPAPPLP
jgi:DNA-binding transcriptional regulator LsrR (DeoR family)